MDIYIDIYIDRKIKNLLLKYIELWKGDFLCFVKKSLDVFLLIVFSRDFGSCMVEFIFCFLDSCVFKV